MINYSLKKIDNKYTIIENQTKLEIKSFDNNNSARKILKHLNFGGGFDGFTPPFMLTKINININS